VSLNVRHQHSSSDVYGISRWLNATLEECWYALPYGQMHIHNDEAIEFWSKK
jgi:hypothetical protein